MGKKKGLIIGATTIVAGTLGVIGYKNRGKIAKETKDFSDKVIEQHSINKEVRKEKKALKELEKDIMNDFKG